MFVEEESEKRDRDLLIRSLFVFIYRRIYGVSPSLSVNPPPEWRSRFLIGYCGRDYCDSLPHSPLIMAVLNYFKYYYLSDSIESRTNRGLVV